MWVPVSTAPVTAKTKRAAPGTSPPDGIRPGYDFGVDETPNRAKFLQQARGLQFGNLSQALVDAAFISVLTGGTSGASGAVGPAEGYIWASPAGDLFVEGANGPVTLWRSQGGWETGRFLFDSGSGDLAAGKPGFPLAYAAGTTLPAAEYHANAASARLETSGRIQFLQRDTGVSGYELFVGRGLTAIGFTANIGPSEAGLQDPKYMFRGFGPAPTTTIWRVNRTDGTDDLRLWMGPVFGINHDSISTSPDFHDSVTGWFFGMHLWGPGGATW